MSKLIAIGEALIDFMPNETGHKLKDTQGFNKAAGGAPANVAAAVCALGSAAVMLTKLGYDGFGDFLVEAMDKAGIDTRSILRTNAANTALAFVSLDESGQRDFSFYRNPSADMLLEADEIDSTIFCTDDILHYCSVDLVDAPVRGAHRQAIKVAKEKGMIISFDPNIRLPLWEDHEEYKKVVNQFIPHADILKVSDEELEFITGIADEDAALETLRDQCPVVIYTKGADGADMYVGDIKVSCPSIREKAVDTTGAGDSFIGGVLYWLLSRGTTKDNLTKLTAEECIDILRLANAVASEVVTKKGALLSMPNLETVSRKIKKHYK